MITTNNIIYHNTPRKRYQIKFPKQGRAKQSFADECNINTIMAKYQKTGAISHFNKHGADYAFATSDDFTTSMQIITTAQDMFDGLPSSIRTRFANDPAQFLDFVQDPDNDDEMAKLGLIPKKEPPESPQETQKTDPPAPATPPDDKTTEKA